MHVDHFLPWSFVREDKIWNFVLACPECNIKKKDKMPNEDYLIRLGERNKKLKGIDDVLIEKEFAGYSYDFLRRMWMYYSYTGVKLFKE